MAANTPEPSAVMETQTLARMLSESLLLLLCCVTLDELLNLSEPRVLFREEIRSEVTFPGRLGRCRVTEVKPRPGTQKALSKESYYPTATTLRAVVTVEP